MAWGDVFSDYEVAGTRSAYHTDTTVNSRRTDHMLFRFGPVPKQGFMAEQMFQGQMQFLENVYSTWQIMGLNPLGGNDPVTKYKTVIQPREVWDGDSPGSARSVCKTRTP